MLSYFFGFIVLTLLSSFWVPSFFLLFVFLFLSLSLLQQNFSLSLNLIFLNNQISSLLFFLTLMLVVLSLSSTPSIKSMWYTLCLTVLGLVLMLAFTTNNLMSFYIFFEASLIPTLLLIICWGYQPERLQAGSYMMLYTVTASLPLLLIVIYMSYYQSTFNIILMSQLDLANVSNMFMLILYGAFLVKLPIYSLHLWLPKAHVEAPLAGSMILAGILLKLGGFGLYLMNKCFDLVTKTNISIFIMALALWGSIMACLMCLRQTDMKALVAYSSVAHMSLVVVGILVNSPWGLMSAMVMMFAHGVTSSALFCMTFFTYTKVNTRSMVYIKGLLQIYPIMAYFWFVLSCANMAAPPTLNLLSELLIIPCLWNLSFFSLIFMGLLVFFSATYNMFLYATLNHGLASSFFLPSKNMKSFELSSIVLHLLPFLLILKLDLFIFFLGN